MAHYEECVLRKRLPKGIYRTSSDWQRYGLMATEPSRKPLFAQENRNSTLDYRESLMKSLWTVWAEYYSTGEGQTLLAWVGYASGAAEARDAFSQRFDPFYVHFCIAGPGVVMNEVTLSLLTEGTAKFMADAAGKANLEFYSKMHVNAA
jgi:hypothetical protein